MTTRTNRVFDVLIGAFAIAAVVVGGIRLRQYREVRANDPTRPHQIANWRSYGRTGNRLGSAHPLVTIVEFADFQCPFCRRADSALRHTREQHPTEIAIVYRHYPLHQHAFMAAVAAECGAKAGVFEAMHDALYSQEDSIGLKPWAHFASDAGVSDTAVFSRCLRDESMAQIVIRDTVAAHELGVHGTPTFLVNDLKVLGFASAASLDSVVTSALMAAKRQDGAR